MAYFVDAKQATLNLSLMDYSLALVLSATIDRMNGKPYTNVQASG